MLAPRKEGILSLLFTDVPHHVEAMPSILKALHKY